MRYRKLGQTDLVVSEIGFGCMSLPESERAATNLVSYALDGGVNFFDTADLYGQGENEVLLGKSIATRRSDVVIATKVGNRFAPGTPGWTWEPTPDYLTKAIHDSLRRLSTDYIDLYQLHGGTLSDPIDDLIDTMESFVKQGLIRYYGISSIRPNVIHQYASRSNIQTVMMQYSILDRRPEEWALPFLNEHGISVIARGPLAKGLLTASYEGKLSDAGFLNYKRLEIMQMNTKLQTLPEYETVGLTGIALGYALRSPTVATVIPGPSTETQLKDILSVQHASLSEDSFLSIRNWSKANNYTEHRT